MSDIPPLKQLCVRCIAIQLFQVNIRWRKVKDVAFTLKDIIIQWKLPPHIRTAVKSGIAEVFRDVKRWDEKHKEMFVKISKVTRVMDKEEHLRIFHNFLIWKYPCYVIDDFATANRLIVSSECKNWPLVQFQFACLYAIKEWIENDVYFDKYRRMTFKRQLAEHPVYDFWLTYLESNFRDKEIFFDTTTRTANQKLQLCFQFAIRFGYYQLVQFIWNRISDTTREYIGTLPNMTMFYSLGFLQWRSLCFRASDRDTVTFLCNKLCQMNAVSMGRISYTMFWSTFYNMLHNEESDIIVEEKFKHRLTFLLDNCCRELRRRLLSMENFRFLKSTFAILLQHAIRGMWLGEDHNVALWFISDASYYNRRDISAMLMNYMDSDQLKLAT